jgi:hypothetical protein
LTNKYIQKVKKGRYEQHSGFLIILKYTIMKFKNILLAVFALAISFFTIISCGNENDKKNKTIETQQQKIQETNVDGGTANTTKLSAGEIALDKLPAGVKKFIEKNYTGYTMEKAAYDPLCEGGDAIDVAVTKHGSPILSLIFKPDGSFVQQEEDVPLTIATGKIKDTLKTRYKGFSAATQMEKLTLADKSVQYLVDLSIGNTTKEVIFTADGVVVCEN